MALVSVAGPLSNLLLATIAAVPLRVAMATGTPIPGLLASLLGVIVSVNIGLALFNLLPIPPLDGHSVLVGILSTIRARWAYNWTNALEGMRLQGPIIFIILIMIDQVLPFSILGLIIGQPYRLLYRLLLGY
jgi:Zn-dependent protease